MHLPHLISDLALILIVAGVTTLIFKRLRQPVVLGYIVAGFLVSPHMPYIMSVMEKSAIQTWAEIGVMFLLFSLGLDFSFKKIVKMGIAPIISAVSIVSCMMLLGLLVGYAFGWGRMNSLFLAGMLAMSSTTIIYKAFDDLGLRQQCFASLVMSVLILEDILAIVMMVMLSTVAVDAHPDGGQMIGSVVKIGFFLVLWFVVGIFLLPLLLRKTRPLMNDETMVIFSLGMCCLMAVISSSVGFSAAFGAFVMGSILAETVEAEEIVRVVEPVKSFFGAIFFVSVGMLVEPAVLVAYAGPIVVLVLTILLGQSVLGTLSFMLSGQPLRTAMRCGFSMAQVGEFAFIIATLGLSLGVIAHFLYPVVVAVSVITTFLTPYMIRLSEPAYRYLEVRIPRRWSRRLNHLEEGVHTQISESGLWQRLLRKVALSVGIYTILCVAIMAIMLSFFLPIVRHFLPHWWANGVCGVTSLFFLSPFIRSIVMKHLHSDEVRGLWTQHRLNRFPLLFMVLVRVILAAAFIFYLVNYLARFADAVVVTIALVSIGLMALSRRLKQRSIGLERLFIHNLHQREREAQARGGAKPQYAGNLLDRDIHIADFMLPVNSSWGGKTLGTIQLREHYGVHVSRITRGRRAINIPGGETLLLPGDRLQVIGSDVQLQHLAEAIKQHVLMEEPYEARREMTLRKLVIGSNCHFIGKNLQESGIRDHYNCMVVGVDEGQQHLTMVTPSRPLQEGDVIWAVGEVMSLDALQKAME